SSVRRIRRDRRFLHDLGEAASVSAGDGWLIGIAVLVGISAFALMQKGGTDNWRWLRWALALGLLVAALVAVTTPTWPHGLGLQTCQSVPNPALEHAPNAQPTTVQTCSDIGATGAPFLLAIALALLLLAPDLSEVGVPGLFSLKARVAQQEDTTARQEQQ